MTTAQKASFPIETSTFNEWKATPKRPSLREDLMWPYATLTDLIYYLLYTLRSCEESPPAKICAFFENSEESWQFFEVSIYFKSKKSPSTFSLQVFTSFSNIASDDIESRASSLRLRIQRIPHQTPLFLRAAQIGSTHSDHSNGYLIGACQRWVHGRSPAWVKPAAELCCNSKKPRVPGTAKGILKTSASVEPLFVHKWNSVYTFANQKN